MKSHFIKLQNMLLILIFILLVSFTMPKDSPEKDKFILQMLNQSLGSWHYQKMNIDDKFSKKAYQIYVERLDYGKRFFTQEDIEQLKKYETDIDDEINKGSYELYELSISLLNKRITDVDTFYKEILSKPFDFNQKEYLETDPEKCTFAKNDKELKDYWRKYLKFQVLERLSDLLKIQEDAIARKDTAYKMKTLAELELDSRNKIKSNYEEWMYRLKKLSDTEKLSMYLNSITSTFDPHTEYLPPDDKARFDIAISGKLEGIGATLQEWKGYIKVAAIVPGSASWKQGELQVNDLIIKVAQAQGEPVSLIDMKIDDAVKLIRGPKGTLVKLTIKKPDGTIKEISIIRDIVELEETFAKSAIISDSDGKSKIGYIYLPKFYVDFENKQGRHCSEDIRKELEKLKSENVSGIIFDLRDNGGGSLQDVVDMSGLFIQQGPIVQVKSRTGSPEVLRDYNSDITYSGPLIIMVNTFSASASEILAAAMQDYNRAVIVGSTTTFGKGTVQRFFNFDDIISSDFKNYKPLGSLKITTQKFYRINGGATQLKGVEPDIVLPDNYKYIDFGEKEMDYAMNWDEISKLNYEKWPAAYNLETIKANSLKRIENQNDFKLIDENAKRLKQQKDETLYSLNLEEYRKEQKQEETDAKKFSNLGKADQGMLVSSIQQDYNLIKSDSLAVKKVTGWHNDIKKDFYIKESLNIMNDMIKK